MADNIYTTFRIAQLISSFRRRIKTRVLSHTAPNKASTAKIQHGLREEFKHEALNVMTKSRSRRHHAHRRNTHAKSPSALAAAGRGRRVVSAERPECGSCSTESLVAKLDSDLSQKGYSVSDLATDSKFISHWYDIDFCGGVQKATELLNSTDKLLSTLKPGCTHNCVQDGNRKMLLADATFAANLEHILLCLQNDLLRFLLFDKAWPEILKHIYECQKEQSRRCEAWFFEFPDARHPLSTTWPWSIRPSLAVLWGVCWMFYDCLSPGWRFDKEGNFLWPDGRILVPARDFQLGYSGQEPIYDSGSPRQSPNSTPPHAPHEGSGHAHSTQPRENYVYDISNDNTPSHVSSVTTSAPTIFAPGPIATSTSSAGLGRQDPISRRQHLEPNFLSEFQSTFLQGTTPTSYITLDPSPRSYPPSSYTTPIMPSDLENGSPKESPISPEKSSLKNSSSPERKSSQEALPFKREDDERSSSAQSPTAFRPANVRRTAPKFNDAGKFECQNCHQIFDRKCEWNKHMDKHERPYKCDKPQCAKLLGFTYSGGLLRHEREVHGMHGGPKEQLFCPIKLCKRHTEQGFTRRENLQEHLRRVHKIHDLSSLEAEDAATPAASEHSDYGGKRKRLSIASQSEDMPDDDVRGELKRLRLENIELRRMWERDISDIKQQLRQISQRSSWRPDGTG